MSTEIAEVLKNVGTQFKIPGEFYAFSQIKNGNINQTYKVAYECDGAIKSYIFQRVNTFVFKKPAEIMENIDKVTTHIRSKVASDKQTLHYHHTVDGKNYYTDCDDNGEEYFWRIMNYIDSVTFDTVDDPAIIYSTGEAFGQFQQQLSDFDGSQLYETIPNFHNTAMRLEQLFNDEVANPVGRCALVKKELDYIRSVSAEASLLSQRFLAGDLPVRVSHNDTKSNNVLFDKVSRRPIVVIDLDTVMPGMAIYDFGDAVRFICNTSVEDEPDLNKVYFSTEKFRDFAKGYLSGIGDGITQIEIDNLVRAAFSITIELASRFLDDYITGDKYFKINYPSHNLVRARCQIKLAQDIEKKKDELCWIIRQASEKNN